MDIIVSHTNADFDAFASMAAAKKLYPDAELVFPGSQEKKVREFIESFHPVPIKRLKDIDFSQVSTIITVDAKSPDRLGPIAELIGKPGITVHVYDHHPHSAGDLRGAVEVIEDVGATATILIEMLMKRKLPPTAVEATLLALGIYEETGNLLFPTTTERDLSALSYLLKHGASLNIVKAYVEPELGIEELDILGELTRTSRELVIGGVRVCLAKASREGYMGDAAHFAHRMMDIMETDALILMLRMQDKVLMVGRSRVHELDAARVLEHFGGGGHPTAASATVAETPLEVLEERVEAVLRATVRPEKTAADIMTKPVVTISSTITLEEAETTLTKYGVNVLPVLKDGLYKGIISREIVEKALFHGFGDSKAMDFATTDALTALTDTPLREIEAAMMERNQRFMPVTDDGHVIGAITRTDLMRAMYEDYLRRSRIGEVHAEEKASMGKNLSSQLKNRFPEDVYNVLRLAGETADDIQAGAYLVGGSVRDLLRGEENLDIDIVVEGDGIAFARKLSTTLGAKVSVHDRFQTAKLLTADLKIDIATARTEYYESPAALPTVEMSSIKKDLYRRDFTINTLAVRLNRKDFGLLVDFFGGRRDLKEKTLRVLHNLSFIEDPTRAFRALRFAERFGFRISKHTENLIRSAHKLDLFDRLSGTRLYEELMLIFHEAAPVHVIHRLADYRLLEVIHPALSFDEVLRSLLTSVEETLLWARLSFIEEKPDAGTLYMMALISGLPDEQKERTLGRLSVPEKRRASIIKGIATAKGIDRALPLGEPAAIYDALQPLSLETVLFAMALSPKEKVKKEISKYLLELRKIRPLLSGDDLKAMGVPPGPVYSRILKELLHEKLKGALKTREDEERYAKRLL